MTDCPNKVTARAGKEPVFNWSEQSEVKMLLLVVELWREISLINLLHLAPITGPTSLAGRWDKKLEGGGGDQ